MSTVRDLDVFAVPLDGVNLVEASAGTGKTWSISALYLRLLLEQDRLVNEILVVTFTNAATAELRERIRTRLLEALQFLDAAPGQPTTSGDPFLPKLFQAAQRCPARPTPGQMRGKLEAALQCFDESAIFTIHGFCNRALGDIPFASGLPLARELLADDSAWVQEIANDFWREQVTAGPLNEDFCRYLLQTNVTPETFADLLTRKQRTPLLAPRWPEAGGAAADADARLRDLQAAKAEARAIWAQHRDEILAAVIAKLEGLNKRSYNADKLGQAFLEWQAFLDETRPPCGWGSNQPLLSADKLKACTNKNQSTPRHVFFDWAATLDRLQQAVTEDHQRRLLALFERFLATAPARLVERKQKAGLIAYADMLGNLHTALTGNLHGGLGRLLQKRYPAALIDEFQDTDPLQFEIFTRIYGGADGGPRGLLFLVGDPKQAIYSFRGADIFAYLRASRQADARYTLRANQRSTTSLIAACNALFGGHGNPFLLDRFAYHPIAKGEKPIAPLRDDTQARGDLHVWMIADSDQSPPSRPAVKAASVRATAAEIARLLGEGRARRIAVGERGLAPKDIAVLVRSHAQASLIKEALRQYGIGSVELSQDSVFASPQAQDLERLLLAIAEPARTGLLRAALATELVGMDGAALLALSEVDLADRVEQFAGYRNQWHEQGFGYLWRRLLRDFQVTVRLLAQPQGERKLTNLLHLGELLQQAATQFKGSESLLRWYAQARQRDFAEDAAQLRLESDENLVQIVTIHKSKGLEYPIVFCPFLWDAQPMTERNGLGAIEYHDAGEGDRLILDFRADEPTRAAAKAQKDMETQAETLRLIYVAVTRAIHRCYLVAGIYGIPAGKGLSLKQARRSMLNWLVAGAGIGADEWLSGNHSADISAAWQDLVGRGHGGVVIEALPREPSAQRLAPEDCGQSLALTQRAARVPQEGWRKGSFSQLIGQAGPAEWPDHDQAADVPTSNDTAEVPSEHDILHFPKGPAAGVCIHAVFELADFTRPETWQPAVQQALQRHPQHGLAKNPLAEQLTEMLQNVLNTPLRDKLRLADIPPGRCLREMEFHFPAGSSLTSRALNGFLERYGYAMPELDFGSLQGFVQGFVDLVFEHRGRYYIVDWKSNHLGTQPRHYGREFMAKSMHEHGYHLQYLIYSLALLRLLRRRLGDNYRHEDHFGGVFYLFIRGVRPDWAQADGEPSGVFFHRPGLDVLEELGLIFQDLAETA